MKTRLIRTALLGALGAVLHLTPLPALAGEVVIIANNNVAKMDSATVAKIYTGKFISVGGINVKPVGLKPGAPSRNRFLQDFLALDEEKFTAYWTVRRYIGKGTPPTEFDTSAELISYVQTTPGAVGYVDESEIKAGFNVVTRR